jgi:endonuclease/exonuclease/phosphatase family metal-dependent hydrolase
MVPVTPSTIDLPPATTRAELTALRQQLSRDVPKKNDNNLLVATWNIREFGDLTEKWRSSSSDTPKRDLDSLVCIGEIISRFDLVAIQEAQANLKALRHMLKWLGSGFTVILTDPVEDDKGGGERLAYVFDRSRVEVSGLACELVVPYSWSPAKRPNKGIPSIALHRQFARTPYAVAFKRRDATFVLVTLHVYWGSKSSQDIAERSDELRSIATWLKEWARDENSWDHNLICLGDFNIDRRGSALWQAFTSSGLTVPEELDHPRTIFGDGTENFFDQIAWFTNNVDGTEPLLSLRYDGVGGSFDWTQSALADTNLTDMQKSFRISDHYPLWVEFEL